MQMHSSEFLKYAYELGAQQALADFEKEAISWNGFATGARNMGRTVAREVSMLPTHPVFNAALQGVNSHAMSGGFGGLAGASLAAAKGAGKQIAFTQAAKRLSPKANTAVQLGDKMQPLVTGAPQLADDLMGMFN